MRALALVALLVGCSSPVIVVLPPDQPDTSASDTGQADTGELPDTTADTTMDTAPPPVDSAEADTMEVGPDTSVVDTGPEACVPLDTGAACPVLPSLLPACGPAPNGCGGKVDCGGCTATRRCAAKSTDPVPHCTCEVSAGGLCVLYSGKFGTKVKCGPIDAPLAEGSTLIPQPDGSITMYCVPSGS